MSREKTWRLVTFVCPCGREFRVSWAEGEHVECPLCHKVWRTEQRGNGVWLEGEEPA